MDKDKARIREMFDTIAPKYDVLNHVLSFGIDRSWRRRLVKKVRKQAPGEILDVATGTCDLSIALAEACPQAQVRGIDLSPEMLEIGKRKIAARGLEGRIGVEVRDALESGFPDGAFDALTVAFGVRNFEDLEKGLREFRRVLKKDGRVYILEFSKPGKGLFASLYAFYSRHVLPMVGRIVSRDKRAYAYLPESVRNFPHGDEFAKILEKAGFSDIFVRKLTFGVATLYTAGKYED